MLFHLSASALFLFLAGAVAVSSFPLEDKEETPKGAEKSGAKSAKGIGEPRIVHKVQPAYPAEAKEDKVQGLVLIEVTVGKDGPMADARVKSGPPANGTPSGAYGVRIRDPISLSAAARRSRFSSSREGHTSASRGKGRAVQSGGDAPDEDVPDLMALQRPEHLLGLETRQSELLRDPARLTEPILEVERVEETLKALPRRSREKLNDLVRAGDVLPAHPRQPGIVRRRDGAQGMRVAHRNRG